MAQVYARSDWHRSCGYDRHCSRRGAGRWRNLTKDTCVLHLRPAQAHTAGQLGVQLAVDLPATPLAPPAPPKPKTSSAKPPRPAKAPKKKAFGEEGEEEEGAGPDQEDALPREPRALRQVQSAAASPA